MKIATMATGGIGGYLAVRLTRIGHVIATIARGAHLAAIRRDGLTLETPDGRTTVTPWVATDEPADVGPVDVVIFAVKGDDLEPAARACLPMIGPDTVVVPFLNGVEASDRLARILPPESVAEGVAYISTLISAPGVVKQVGTFNKFVIAERDSRPSARIDALCAAINEAGSNAPPTEDVQAELWRKFVLFSAMSGVTAAARCTIRDVLDNPPLGELYRGVFAETAALGRARGVNLPDGLEDDLWQFVTALPPTMRASTAVDLENGRPLEIEWISGAVMRLSREAGLDAPINTTLYAILSPYRHGKPT